MHNIAAELAGALPCVAYYAWGSGWRAERVGRATQSALCSLAMASATLSR
jgi:hypothetical protein